MTGSDIGNLILLHGLAPIPTLREIVEYDLTILLAEISDDNLHGEVATGDAVGNEF